MTEKKTFTFKLWHGILLGVMILVAIGVHLNSLRWGSTWIRINDTSYHVWLSKTPQHWFKGLSGRQDLGGYDGMLFVFNTREQHAMVMRDMLFPIDIVWIQDGVIIDMAPNLQPDNAATEAELRVYTARLPSDMVLELPAGFIALNALKVGDAVVVAR